jgi:hypothetical protein
MKYPAIIRNDNEVEMLLLNEDSAIILSEAHKGQVHDAFPRFRRRYVDITHEYLSNTWGVVESKEHAEFIIELAELHGFELAQQSSLSGSFFSFDIKGFCFLNLESIASRHCNKITIPLPPKAKEWPQVGDEVCWGFESSGVIKSLSDGFAWIKEANNDYTTVYTSSLKKPKSKQDLLIEELQTKLCNNNAVDNYILACDTINGEIEGLSYEQV